MWGYSWIWMLWLLFFAVLIWTAFSRRPAQYFTGPWNYGGPGHGGPDTDFARWSVGASGKKGRGPRDYRRSDQRIEEDINDRLTVHDAIDARDVQVSVHDGRVVLTGVVESRADRRVAEAIADSIAGTVDVENRLAIGKLSP